MAQTPDDSAAQVVELAGGYVLARAVQAAAHFGVADHLADGPKSAQDLARLTGTDQVKLARLMRALTGAGVFTEDADGRFALTPRGDALRADAPGCARAAVLLLGSSNMWGAFAGLPNLLSTNGNPGGERHRLFSGVGHDPVSAARLSEGMTGFAVREAAAVAEAYDGSGFHVIADVGGNNGNLLTTLLLAWPGTRGVLYDLPHVVALARRVIDDRNLAARCEIVTGSFFEAVPAGADAYILSHVLHDWPEPDCLTLLRNIRRAMPRHGRLLIVEYLIPDRNVPHRSRYYDLILLAMTGGRERTAEEYAALIGQAGFRIERVVPTRLDLSVIDAVPV
jgi:hypothetical protein